MKCGQLIECNMRYIFLEKSYTISRSKDNQTMKFDQSIECNMTNIFLEKSYTKCGGKTTTKSSSEKSKLSISLDQQSKVLYSLLLLYDNLRAIEIYQNQAADYLLSSHIKLFEKSKKKSETSLATSFSAWLLKKNISLVIFH